ncbi:type II secretion system protein GspJ [Trichloromonas sp.]|uniref:type II secretion system protein GspJ n=1 Tax=Trichloromonas sp. TaxID=3069249 RepID=UPI003D816F6B
MVATAGKRTDAHGAAPKGFTLVEVLVAVAITSMVLLAVYGVFASVSGAKQRLETDGEAYHRARVLFDRIGRELRSAYVKPSGTDTFFRGGHSNNGHPYLTLTTTAVTPQSNARGIAVVHYELIEDHEVKAGNKVLMRQETSPLNPAAQNQPGYRLAPGIEEMSIRFYNGDNWQDEWDSSSQGLPQLVEIAMRIKTAETTLPFRSAFELPVIQAH